jgi:spore maturation protein CgeB
MFDTPEELAEKILYFLPCIDERSRFALAAHRRAVPAYSLDRRAKQVVSAIEVFLGHDSVSSK